MWWGFWPPKLPEFFGLCQRCFRLLTWHNSLELSRACGYCSRCFHRSDIRVLYLPGEPRPLFLVHEEEKDKDELDPEIFGSGFERNEITGRDWTPEVEIREMVEDLLDGEDDD